MKGPGAKISKQLIAFWHSFPLRLLQVHVKHNPFLLLYWFILFMVVGGSFGKALGIPYLFLDPVYLNKVNWLGFMILGITLCGFAMAFNITGYILDSFRFPFLGTLRRPFTHYCLNNSILPLSFLLFHVISIYRFQTHVELKSPVMALEGIGGLLLGYLIMLTFLLTYFMSTNRDVTRLVPKGVQRKKKAKPGSKGKKLSKTVIANKKNAFKKLQKLKRTKVKVSVYLDLKLRVLSARSHAINYDRLAILRVFMQNQKNAILIQLLIILVIFSLGAFQNSSAFQIPAAASGVILLTVIVMITGALSFWLRSWLLTGGIGLIILINLLFSFGWLTYEYPAYGLDYQGERQAYTLETIRQNVSPEKIEASKAHMISILENWKARTGQDKPRMVLVTASGGGQRSALWTLNVLQHADSVAQQQLMEQTTLITGASGGLFGAAYYRDLYMNQIDRNSEDRLTELGNEVLNPVIFTLLVNDLLLKVRSFEYGGFEYKRERGYEFEQKVKENLLGMLDHPISFYEEPERTAAIPLLIVNPTITNDGRKLYISAQPTEFFNIGMDETQSKVQGVDFRSMLKAQQSDSLRFLTALRMSATFPYVTPTISLPTTPPIQIADAGISDNYGISDAMIYLKVFKDWIIENTSQVVLIAIRDSEKDGEIVPAKSDNLFEKFFSPIQGVYKSWDQIQTIRNEQRFDMLKTIYGDQLQRVDFEYIENKTTDFNARASLSWRLTEREKRDILEAIHNQVNQESLTRLDSLMSTKDH